MTNIGVTCGIHSYNQFRGSKFSAMTEIKVKYMQGTTGRQVVNAETKLIIMLRGTYWSIKEDHAH